MKHFASTLGLMLLLVCGAGLAQELGTVDDPEPVAQPEGVQEGPDGWPLTCFPAWMQEGPYWIPDSQVCPLTGTREGAEPWPIAAYSISNGRDAGKLILNRWPTPDELWLLVRGEVGTIEWAHLRSDEAWENLSIYLNSWLPLDYSCADCDAQLDEMCQEHHGEVGPNICKPETKLEPSGHPSPGMFSCSCECWSGAYVVKGCWSLVTSVTDEADPIERE